MNGKQRRSLSDYKVGIFVLVACIVLALAIFSIGSQVGLFEDQFWAMTYLSNVSGLKPGDVVLLAGIEVGNVDAVRISEPGQLPQTQQNQRVLQQIEDLTGVLQIAQTELESARQQQEEISEQYRQAVESQGEDSPQATTLREQLNELRERVAQREETVDELQEDLADARARLQNIRVVMRINSRYRDWIREDSNISLGSIGLLGDKYIEISLGRSDAPAPLVPMERERWLGTTTEQAVMITGTQVASFEELIT
ncbi:MAG TPA: MlaD family protein, partial [Acidobacteriota bacterium]|nr:MlaD family protein [Acidobacteriota bacterium]